MYLVVSGLFLAVLQIRERQHAAERSELLDRLMARDFNEYKTMTTDEPTQGEPAYVSEEEEWAREIEQTKSR